MNRHTAAKMTRLQALRIIVAHLAGDELMVHANGAISRESYFCRDRERNIYLLGSMGLPAAVGLGIALHQPRHRVVVLDGDGNLLMGFGNLPLVGALKPKNFTHFVLDNGAYETTGNQPSISIHADLRAAALACGYREAHDVSGEETLQSLCTALLHQPGPHFIRVMVSQETPEKAPRIPYTAQQMKKRFMKAISV
jgi:thiamine pyrophosphate-dependent acetolactate synthase large subunit-like protein